MKIALGPTGVYRPLIGGLVLANGTSLLLFGLRVIDAQNFRFWFLLWNLCLAWLPALAAVWLVRYLCQHRWLSWGGVGLSIVWLGFLPNSFYLVSDLIHLRPTGDVNVLYDAVMFASFIFNGYTAGFISMYLIHAQAIRRLPRRSAHSLMAAVIVLSSFAIYLGRSLRWNTWDALLNPFGLLFDISERLINPLVHIQTFVTTLMFSLLIGSMYIVIWQLAQLLPPPAKARRKRS